MKPKAIIAWPLCQIAYYLGRVSWLLLEGFWEDEFYGWRAQTLFRIYNRCMVISWRLNEWAGLSVWHDTVEL